MDRQALIASNCLLLSLKDEPSCQLTKEALADGTRSWTECKTSTMMVAILATLVLGNVILKIASCNCIISLSGTVESGPALLLTTGSGDGG